MELQGGAFTSFISCQSTRVFCLVQPAIQNQHLPPLLLVSMCAFGLWLLVSVSLRCIWIVYACSMFDELLCLANRILNTITHERCASMTRSPSSTHPLRTLKPPPPSLQLSFRLALLILSCADLLMQYKFDVCRLKTRYTLTVSETFPERRSPQKKDCWHQLLSAVLLVLSFSLAKKWIRGVHLTQKRNKNTKIVK